MQIRSSKGWRTLDWRYKVASDMFDYQDATLVMFHCRRCSWLVCLETDDIWLLSAARGQVVTHVQSHGILSESEEVSERVIERLDQLASNYPWLTGAGGSDEPIMEGIERLLKEARGETK